MSKKFFKTILINLLILYNFLILILFAPSIGYFAYRFLIGSNNQSKIRKNYKNRKDLIGPLIEFEKLSYSYHDFIIWRRNKYNGNFININSAGVRQSLQPELSSIDEYIFFGGSTMFGYGVEDNKTIPSLFSKSTQKNVINLGDTGYTARQSLALYTNYLINNKFNPTNNLKIITYDGANDIWQRCRREVKGIETEQQIKIREKLNIKYGSINYFLRPWKLAFNFFNPKINPSVELLDCHKDSQKAEYVAETLIRTWRKMYEIAKSNNHEFTAVLQPVIYLEGEKINKDFIDIYGKQFVKVYPIIKKKVQREKFNFLDLTNELKGKRHTVYIDFCHLDSKGNKFIAEALKNYLLK